MYDVHILTPALSEQWIAEVQWWTQFFVQYKIFGVEVRPLSGSILKEKHSKLNIVNLDPSEDPNAVKKFLQMTNNRKYDDDIIILRNLFADTTSKLRDFDNVETFRKYCDLSKRYQSLDFPLHGKSDVAFNNFGDILDALNQTDERLHGLLFSYDFFETQDFIQEEYRKLFADLDPELEKRLLSGKRRSHAFLWWGTKWITPLHAAPASAYLFQVANAKRWRFIHKRYTPYVGVRIQPGGILGTPVYFSENYPSPIPFTELTLNPGDLMYWSTWMYHQVHNLVPDKLGFAIGIRPSEGYLNEKFGPMKLFNILNIPSHLIHMMQKNTFGDDSVSKACGSRRGLDHGLVYNGTTLSRYDFQMKDGKCYMEERVSDYQKKEILGSLGVHDWQPNNPVGNVIYQDN